MDRPSLDEVKSEGDIDKDILYALMSCGLSNDESRLYKILVGFGMGVGAYEISHYSKIIGLGDHFEKKPLYYRLNKLIKKGIVEKIEGRRNFYFPIQPNKIPLILKIEDPSEELEYNLNTLQSRWKTVVPPEGPKRALSGERVKQALQIFEKMKGGANKKNINQLNRDHFRDGGFDAPSFQYLSRLRKLLVKKLEKGKLKISDAQRTH